MNIPEMWLRIKGFGEALVGEWGIVIIVFLVALCSFALGRLSALEGAKPPVAMLQAAEAGVARSMPEGGYYLAAKTGSAYYYPWCGGAARISPENLVVFKTSEDAKKAGYAPAKNCKGLQ